AQRHRARHWMAPSAIRSSWRASLPDPCSVSAISQRGFACFGPGVGLRAWIDAKGSGRGAAGGRPPQPAAMAAMRARET
ncbi:MAG: hypothetical protein ACRDIF_05570, partial [Actinomycetota bacterium]